MRHRARRALVPLLALAVLQGLATPAVARGALGLFGGWGAFRDMVPNRVCYAIAQPVSSEVSRAGVDRGTPYLTVSTWPNRRGARGQLHVTGGYVFASRQPVELRLGARSFALSPQWDGAWTADEATDRQVLALMKQNRTMTIAATSLRGTRIVDTYALDGFAAAWDAAQAGCARPG